MDVMNHRTAHASIRDAILGNDVLTGALGAAAAEDACLMPNPGNLGDGLIQLGTLDLLDDLGLVPPIVNGCSPAQFEGRRSVIIGGGGGWIEGLWEHWAHAARGFLEAGGRMIVLPSSIVGFDDLWRRHAGQVTIFAREKATLDHLLSLPEMEGHAFFCHDLAFAVRLSALHRDDENRGQGTVRMFRTDAESARGRPPVGSIDLSLLWNGDVWGDRRSCSGPLRAAAHLMSQFATLETDRLHMAALAAMLGLHVRMYANAYYKNRSVYDATLHLFDNVEFVEAQQSRKENGVLAVGAENDWDDLRKRNAALTTTSREYYEPEMARLRDALTEAERVRLEWFGPEIQRLTDLITEAEYVKSEWFVPELARREAGWLAEKARGDELERRLRALLGEGGEASKDITDG